METQTINLIEFHNTFHHPEYKGHYVLAGVGHVLVCCDDGLEAQINNLYFTDGIHGTHHQLRDEGSKQHMREKPIYQQNQQVETGYLVEVTISHQLVLVLQSVLEQGPYDWLQLSVRGQQIRAEHFQPGVGQPVHCRGGMSDSSVFIYHS